MALRTCPESQPSRSAELDAHEADQTLQRLLDDLGVWVAKDGVTLAFVGVGARLSDLREAGLDDEVAELLLRLLEAMDLDDATRGARVTALTAKERGAGGEAAAGEARAAPVAAR